MKFILKITKDILKKSSTCGSGIDNHFSSNCAFSLAFRELIPNTLVLNYDTHFLRQNTGLRTYDLVNSRFPDEIAHISHTQDQTAFIKKFDNATIFDRIHMAEKEFEVEIPDNVIEYYYKDAVEVAQKLINNPVLQLKHELV